MQLIIDGNNLFAVTDDGKMIQLTSAKIKKNKRNYGQEILQILSSGPVSLVDLRKKMKTSETNLYSALAELADKIVKTTVNRKAVYSLTETV